MSDERKGISKVIHKLLKRKASVYPLDKPSEEYTLEYGETRKRIEIVTREIEVLYITMDELSSYTIRHAARHLRGRVEFKPDAEIRALLKDVFRDYMKGIRERLTAETDGIYVHCSKLDNLKEAKMMLAWVEEGLSFLGLCIP